MAPGAIRLSASQRTWVGALAAAFPDIDYATFWINPLLFLSDWHRGPTHSLVMLPLWAALLGVVSAYLCRRREQCRDFTAIAAIGLASHILTDLITVYGTAVFYPISDWRPGLAITFVIDPWLSGLVLGSLLLSFRWPGAALPRLGFTTLLLYLSAQALLQARAEAHGRIHATAHRIDFTSIRALAQPLSPAHWYVVIETQDEYHLARIRLTPFRTFPIAVAQIFGLDRVLAAYRPISRADWQTLPRLGATPAERALALEVWEHPLMTDFRRFARYPIVYRADRTGERTCVWFTDLRFTFPGMAPAFRFGLCRSSVDQPWQLFRIRQFTEHDIQAL